MISGKDEATLIRGWLGGASSKAIGRKIGKSPETVHYHVRRLGLAPRAKNRRMSESVCIAMTEEMSGLLGRNANELGISKSEYARRLFAKVLEGKNEPEPTVT